MSPHPTRVVLLRDGRYTVVYEHHAVSHHWSTHEAARAYIMLCESGHRHPWFGNSPIPAAVSLGDERRAEFQRFNEMNILGGVV
jgi:hypothetical protein